MKKLSTMLLTLLLAVSSTHAAKWDSETRKAFRKAECYALFVDFSKAKISGLDSAEFVSYYCDKERKSPDFLGITYKRFRYELARKATKTFKRNFLVEDSTCSFGFTFNIYELTEDAGMRGVLTICPRGREDMAKVYDFFLDDGRLNTFDELLVEAAEKLGKKLVEIKYADIIGMPSFYKERKEKK